MLNLVEQKVSTIYIELLDEGTDCWRPASAVRLSAGVYRIIGTKPEDETWRFQPGDVVRCTEQHFSEGDGLVAYEKVASSI
jgi:hypothetical protein